MKRHTIIPVLLIIIAIALALRSPFAENSIEKIVAGVIGAVSVAYTLINAFWKDEPWVRRINHTIYRIAIIGPIIVKPEKSDVKPEDYKPRAIKYVSLQCKQRLETITSPDIFTDDFEIEPLFTAGSDSDDIHKDWRFAPNAKRFSVITGEAGSGKSFELVKRAKILIDELEEKRLSGMTFTNEKIPLYVELGTLNMALDHYWLENYVYKTFNLLKDDKQHGQNIDRSYVQAFLQNAEEVIFFFDGFDEIPAAYREETLSFILELSRKTTVTFACRSQVYKEQADFLIINMRMPCEYHITPPSKQMMITIIDRLDEKSEEEKGEMREFINKKTKEVSAAPGTTIYAEQQDLLNPHSRPIVFALFIKVYSELPEDKREALLTADLEEMLDILWAYYEDFFAIKKAERHTDILGLRAYGVWIAKIMKGKAFYVESVQPNWLQKVVKGYEKPDKMLRGVYYLTTRILATIMIGFALECIACTPFSLLGASILGGTAICLLAGLYKALPTPTKFGRVADTLFAIVLVISLVGVCAVYQGYAVPRDVDNGRSAPFSLNEMFPGILLGLILSIVFSYRIIIEKKTGKYVQPVNRYQFSPIHATRYSLLWGLISGLFVGAAGWYIWFAAPETPFIQNWLLPILRDLWKENMGWGTLEETNTGFAVFLYGSIVAFTAVSILVAVLVGRYESEDTKKEDAAGQNMHFGIRAWAVKALRRAALVFLMAAGIYFAAMQVLHIESMFHLGKIAFGAAAASFLWFGGMEAVNHVLLILSLSARGIVPRDYYKWVDTNLRMALVRRQGYKNAFYHHTLGSYYQRQPLTDNPRMRIKEKPWWDKIVYILLLTTFLALLLMPFATRYWWKLYWPDTHQVYIPEKDLRNAQWQYIHRGTYSVSKSDTLELKASGVIQVGTFVGLVLSPYGTTEGYMGMPLKKSYNIPGLDTYRHAALLVRQWKNNGIGWSSYNYVSGPKAKAKILYLEIGDSVQFIVNDNEYQNNLGHFKLRLHHPEPSETDTAQKKQ